MRTSVLLVEDDDDDAALIARVLSRFTRIQFDVSRVATIAAARQALREQRHDAVLVDLGLPDSDGLASFTEILAVASGAAVVVLTGDDREELGLRAVELGAQEYVVKTEHAYQLLPLTIAYSCERQRHHLEVQELTAALANAVDAIATLDADGRCAAVNPAFQALLGYAPPEVEPTQLLDLVHEADRQRVATALSTQGMEEHAVRMIRKDGRIVPVQLSVVARARGRGHFCFVRDLTRQKLVEGKLASAAAITAVGSLATGLAHEINNPLAVVLANVEEASRVTLDLEVGASASAKVDLADLRTMLEEALAASQRVQFIVRDLRAFACADDRRGRVDVNAVIEACCNIAFAEIRHRARLAKDLRATIPVLGSEAKLAQVFLNLLVNAAHAMPEGDVERNQIQITTTQQGRTAIVVEVSDTGSGISATNAGQVFDPFFTTKPRRPGMGLAICQATVAAHGGDISIRPREGGGTVVRLLLPTLEAEVSENPLGGQAEGGPQQRRVLVVDDDPLVLRSLTRVLARDFEVASARNGREALDLVRAGGTFDAMLCDLMMPELSGIELHELLERDDPELAKRTVFLTGGAFSGRAQTFLEAVGQPHLEKPVDLKVVRELLMELSQTPHAERPSAKWLG
ncbi:MAG: response regulator [Labilithrix sp.]|nr:response regulator [Labilithrix sp.]MBX3221641.1 response regulator [Labilithrix sp.]